jgi:hypothetical protein
MYFGSVSTRSDESGGKMVVFAMVGGEIAVDIGFSLVQAKSLRDALTAAIVEVETAEAARE